jgi:hypothetical protein
MITYMNLTDFFMRAPPQIFRNAKYLIIRREVPKSEKNNRNGFMLLIESIKLAYQQKSFFGLRRTPVAHLHGVQEVSSHPSRRRDSA